MARFAHGMASDVPHKFSYVGGIDTLVWANYIEHDKRDQSLLVKQLMEQKFFFLMSEK